MIKQAIKSIDILGHEIGFEHKEASNLKTYQGAAISFFCIVTICVISFIFGQEVYQRKAPYVTVGKEKIQESKIDLKEYPFYITITDVYGGQRYEARSYMDFIVERFTFAAEDGALGYETDFGLDECKNQVNSFEGPIASLMREEIKNSILFNLCLNLDLGKERLSIKNDYLTYDSSFFRIRIVPCYLGLEANRSTECKMKKGDIYPFAPNVIFSTFDSYVVLTEIENSISYFRKSDGYIIDTNILNSVTQTITMDYLVTDRGWIIESKVGDSYSHMDKFIALVSLSDNPGLAIHLNTSKIRNKTERSYIKVQDLLAKIGGLANGILIIVRIIFYNYLRYLYLSFVHKSSIKTIIHDNNALKEKINSNFSKLDFKLNKSGHHLLNTSNVANNTVKVISFLAEPQVRNNRDDQPKIEIQNNYSTKYANYMKIFNNPSNTSLTEIKQKELKMLQNGLDPKKEEIALDEVKLNHSSYVKANLFCCFSDKNVKRVYKQEMDRVKLLLNFSTLSRFLTEQYSFNYACIAEA